MHNEAVMSRLALRLVRVRVAELRRPRKREHIIVENAWLALRRLARTMVFRKSCSDEDAQQEDRHYGASLSHTLPLKWRWTPSQKSDFLSFIRDDGKGFVGVHSATITFTSWPEYGEMIGGYFTNIHGVLSTRPSSS